MNKYNYLNLSYSEFETLSRDLLQLKFNITYESFTEGTDDGIDFRYMEKGEYLQVVQCKRYAQYPNLKQIIKKEIEKIRILSPKKYILITTVGLTPNNKEELMKILYPFVLEPSDIIGRDDLDNLISKFPEIESKHFKLWLTNTNVIEQIINKNIFNETSFEKDSLIHTAKTYVYNESFNKAIEILNNFKTLIISGIPGIGKSTSARILVMHYLYKSYKEFIFISSSIDDAYSVYNEKKSQIFLFDDFLGRNFLMQNLPTNEESRILRFLKKIQSSKNKLFILATREYILSQAKQKYDLFKSENIDFLKCVIDLSQYTKLIRAQILYNHLYFSEIPDKYIKSLIEKRNYLKIINHKNYNPRIIETILDPTTTTKINHDEYFITFLNFLNNPTSVWLHAYENQISDFSRYLLLVLLSTGTPVLLDDLKQSLSEFVKINNSKYNLTYNEQSFIKSLKELENTFIKIEVDYNHLQAIEFQNPSVFDFLINYLKEYPETVFDLISSSKFLNQYFVAFSTKREEEIYDDKQIIIGDELIKLVKNKIVENFDDYKFSTIYKLHYSSLNKFSWTRKHTSKIQKISYIITKLDLNYLEKIYEFLILQFRNEKIIKINDTDDLRSYIDCLIHFKNNLSVNPFYILNTVLNKIEYLSELYTFKRLKDLFPKTYNKFIKKTIFIEQIKDLIKIEIDNIENENISDLISDIEHWESEFNLDFSYEVSKLKDIELEKTSDDANNKLDRFAFNSNFSMNSNDYEKEIDGMFSTLIHHKKNDG